MNAVINLYAGLRVPACLLLLFKSRFKITKAHDFFS
jgi:hypothetical protein